MAIDARIRRLVRERAGLRCEYCQLSEKHSPVARLQVEHIVPRKHGGVDAEGNLALACIDCNLRKGSNLTGLDPDSGNITPLFHPRRQSWTEHFRWDGVRVLGLTPEGRTTIRVLELNSPDRVQLRLALAS
ncbi:MAG TPA: HNH endonuclease [Verrucomicrobiales bacterium]|nr:HNH endonuclease [Verrucomicrobiales bacterium]